MLEKMQGFVPDQVVAIQRLAPRSAVNHVGSTNSNLNIQFGLRVPEHAKLTVGGVCCGKSHGPTGCSHPDLIRRCCCSRYGGEGGRMHASTALTSTDNPTHESTTTIREIT